MGNQLTAGQAVPAVRLPAIDRLMLSQFRSYEALTLTPDARMIALTGENGAGKTNILEAISLLAPGRGLRRADFSEMAREGGGGTFALSARLTGHETGNVLLGTGLAQAGTSQRLHKIDREPAVSIRDFAAYIRIVWLTPAMDGLFAGSPGERRRYLDRLVLAVDAAHAQRCNTLERALRNRNKLLETGIGDAAWLDAAERETAELAVAVAAARAETIDRLAGLIAASRDDGSPFPWAGIALEGEFDNLVATCPALEAETRYRAILREFRARDAAAGRTLFGPQASDLRVWHGPKSLPAEKASTGEQKALLVGLTLAHASLVASMSGSAPVILLDEVAAHFDVRRRTALFERLSQLGSQVWMTSADPAVFEGLPSRFGLARLAISPGQAQPVQDA
ncbi:MAG: DNA replication/repair protein RecF [Alphaproteobacteria bacterium]|nr:DNA replication/repair protein RecF [Alphaproteobacteria bacterium]